MLPVLITLTRGRRNQCINCQNAKVHIPVLPIMDVKTCWNATIGLFEQANWLRESTREWLKNPKYGEYQPLFTIQAEWTNVKYVIEVLRRFRYWRLWMSKRHTVTLHNVITEFNDMFNHMDGIMRSLAKKQTQWMEDMFLEVKLARQKLSQYNADLTPSTGMLLIVPHILDSFRKLRSFR